MYVFMIFIFPFLIKLMKLKNIVSKKKAKLSNDISFKSKEKVIYEVFFIITK